jgi:phosphoserine phosphatase RsbU/P
VLREYEYRNNQFQLQCGDMLVIYTDGIVEARDAHENMFGNDRLRELVATGPSSAQALLDNIVNAVQEHQQSTLGTDDQTLVVLKITH